MCMDGEVRLVGGKSEREGRVEMCYNGVWGVVCANNGWDEIAANVVCDQLGYNELSEFSSLKSQCCYLPMCPSKDLALKTLGRGNSPLLFHNITCKKTHSMF